MANFALRGEHKKYKTGGSFNALYEIGEHVARALNSSGRTIAPTALVKNLRALSKTFRKGRQEDAHELARCLLDAMHKKCVEVVKPKDIAEFGACGDELCLEGFWRTVALAGELQNVRSQLGDV